SNLSIVIFQSLIEVVRRFTIRQTIMCDFVKPSGLEIIADFAAVDAVFRRVYAENLSKEFQCPFAVALEVRQYFPDIKMPLGAETAGVEKNVGGDGNTHDGSANVDIRK